MSINVNPPELSKPPPESADERHAREEAEKVTQRQHYRWLAILIESVLGMTSAAGSVSFAALYGTTLVDQAMMVLAPLGFLVVELARVPITVLSVSLLPKIPRLAVLIVVLLPMAGITAERLAMLSERAYAPRLLAVDRTKAGVEDATEAKEVADKEFAAAQATEKTATAAYMTALDHSKSASVDLTKLPRKTCYKGHCQADGRQGVLNANVAAASDMVVVAQKAMTGASAKVLALDPSRASQNLRSAILAHHEALATSQMHGFAAHAIFGTSPPKITDEQLGWLLRICIFGPAVVVSLAASFIAALSAKPYQKPAPVEAPDGEDTIKISGSGMAEFGAAVSEYGQTLREAEDVLRDDSAPPEHPAPATVEPPAVNAKKGTRTGKNAALDGRTRQGKAAKRKAKNGTANNVLTFPPSKQDIIDDEIHF
jgi:hypothetical protein